MEMPLVSVVMATFNGERFLEEQLRSIFAQTYRPIELVISDDASEDSTPSILSRYEKTPGVQIFYQQKNHGIASNFSFAASQASGRFMAFSDQDDIWEKNKIERLVSEIGDSNLIYSDSLLVSENGNSLNKKLSDLRKMYSGSDSRGYFLYSCVWGHGMMITRELLQKSLPVPAAVNHDIWIAYQAFMSGGIKYLDEALTKYRQYDLNNSRRSLLKEDSKEKRWLAYKQKMRWVTLMKQNGRPEFQVFYERLSDLYTEKEKRAYVFPLVPFMLKHRKAIFQYSKKGFASHLVEIMKQARNEKPF